MFDKLIGNDPIKEILERLIKTNRVPHSLLFTGRDGIGKKQFALQIAKTFACQDLVDRMACDVCGSCKRVSKFEFPKFDDRDAHKEVIFSEYTDVGMVIPYRNNILVNAIRKLEQEANYLPYEGRARFFLIDDADRMTDAAANALLKTLEEPVETTYLFLISSKPNAFLPTILSRCQTIRFSPIEAKKIEKHLLAKKGLPTEEAKLIAKLSFGSLVEALKIEPENYYQIRYKMLDVVRSLSNKRNFSILLKTTEELSDVKNKDSYVNNVNVLQTLIHDIWTTKNNPNTEIINFDILQNIEQFAQITDIQTLAKWMKEIEILKEKLAFNLNRKIATDALFMKMAG